MLLALLLLLAPPAEAKGPTQVEVHDLRTGATTLLDLTDHAEMGALGEIVGWPERPRAPRGVASGVLEHVATLTWQYGDEMPAWVDRIYSDDTGRAWVERLDHLSGSGAVHWGRMSGYAFDAVLTALHDDATGTSALLQPRSRPASDPATPPAADAESTSDPTRRASGGFDAASFGWGAGLSAVAAVVLWLIVRLGRLRSARAALS